MSEGRLGPASNSCDTAGDDGLGPTSEGRDDVDNGVQGTPDGGCDRMCNDRALLVLTVTGCVVAIYFIMVVRILVMGAMTR